MATLGAVWPGFLTIKNTLPSSAGIDSKTLLAVFIFWGLQIMVSLIRIPKLRWFFAIKLLIAIPCLLSMIIWSLAATKGGGPLISQPAHITTGKGLKVAAALNSMCSQYATLAVNAADFTRFSKTGRVTYVQIFVFPFCAIFPYMAALFTVNAAMYLFSGTNSESVAEVLTQWDSRAAVFFCGACWILANSKQLLITNMY